MQEDNKVRNVELAYLGPQIPRNTKNPDIESPNSKNSTKKDSNRPHKIMT